MSAPGDQQILNQAVFFQQHQQPPVCQEAKVLPRTKSQSEEEEEDVVEGVRVKKGLHIVVQSKDPSNGEFEDRVHVVQQGIEPAEQMNTAFKQPPQTTIQQANNIIQSLNNGCTVGEFIPNEPTPANETAGPQCQGPLIPPPNVVGQPVGYLQSTYVTTGTMPEVEHFSSDQSNVGQPLPVQRKGNVANVYMQQIENSPQPVVYTQVKTAVPNEQPTNAPLNNTENRYPQGLVSTGQDQLANQQQTFGQQQHQRAVGINYYNYQPQGHHNPQGSFDYSDHFGQQKVQPNERILTSSVPSSPPTQKKFPVRKLSSSGGTVKTKADHWVQQNSSSSQIQAKGAPWSVKGSRTKTLASARVEGVPMQSETMQPIHVITSPQGERPPVSEVMQTQEEPKSVLLPPVYSQHGLLTMATRSPPGAIASLANGVLKNSAPAQAARQGSRLDQLPASVPTAGQQQVRAPTAAVGQTQQQVSHGNPPPQVQQQLNFQQQQQHPKPTVVWQHQVHQQPQETWTQNQQPVQQALAPQQPISQQTSLQQPPQQQQYQPQQHVHYQQAKPPPQPVNQRPVQPSQVYQQPTGPHMPQQQQQQYQPPVYLQHQSKPSQEQHQPPMQQSQPSHQRPQYLPQVPAQHQQQPHSWTLLKAVKPPETQATQPLSPSAPWAKKEWKSVQSPRSEQPPSFPVVQGGTQQVPYKMPIHDDATGPEAFSTPPTSPIKKQAPVPAAMSAPSKSQPAAVPAPASQHPTAMPAPPSQQSAAMHAPPTQQSAAIHAPPSQQSAAMHAPPSQQSAAMHAPSSQQSAAMHAPPSQQSAAMHAPPSQHPTAMPAPPSQQSAAIHAPASQPIAVVPAQQRPQNLQFHRKSIPGPGGPVFQNWVSPPTPTTPSTPSTPQQAPAPQPQQIQHRQEPVRQQMPQVATTQKSKAPPPVLPKPKLPTPVESPNEWPPQQNNQPQFQQRNPPQFQQQAPQMNQSVQPPWKRGAGITWPPTKPPQDFTGNQEPEAKNWTLEKPQQTEIRSTLEHTLGQPRGGSVSRDKPQVYKDTEDVGGANGTTGQTADEGKQNVEHLLKPSLIKAQQPKYTPEQLKAMDMTIPKAIKSISTAELLHQYQSAWDDADIGAEPEVVRCGLPEHKRPGEADNDTDVEKCIKRLQENDSTLVEVNLNNMKRTPIPQLQRLIAALRENTHLKKLSLANLGLSDSAMEILLEIIEQNTTLEVLNIETNFLTGNFLVRLFQSALVQQTLREVKAVNQSVTFSNAQEQEMMKAIYRNRALVKCSLNLRLTETRSRVEKALIRNGELRRLQRKLEAEGWDYREYMRSLSKQDDEVQQE